MWSKDESSMEGENKGAGFMDTSLNSSIEGKSAGGFRRSQNCVPIMIGHAVRHGENLQIWGEPPRLVTTVALVKGYEDNSMKVTFELQDETGTIKGVKWLEIQNEAFQCPVQINSYARIHGSIRQQNNETYILIMKIQPLQHLNELLTHLMEVTATCLEGERKVEQVLKVDSKIMNDSRNMTVEEVQSGMSSDQLLVYEIIKSGNAEYGAEINEIKSKVPPHVLPQLGNILSFLADEGHVYTTKTDDYFKAV